MVQSAWGLTSMVEIVARKLQGDVSYNTGTYKPRYLLSFTRLRKLHSGTGLPRALSDLCF